MMNHLTDQIEENDDDEEKKNLFNLLHRSLSLIVDMFD